MTFVLNVIFSRLRLPDKDSYLIEEDWCVIPFYGSGMSFRRQRRGGRSQRVRNAIDRSHTHTHTARICLKTGGQSNPRPGLIRIGIPATMALIVFARSAGSMAIDSDPELCPSAAAGLKVKLTVAHLERAPERKPLTPDRRGNENVS